MNTQLSPLKVVDTGERLVSEDAENPVQKAIDAVGGSLRELASRCGVSYQAVQRWRDKGEVPAKRVLKVEKESGISRHELRPDLYPPNEYGGGYAQ